MKLGKLLGQGERSKVYQHPTESDKVVKVTSSKKEIEVLEAFYEEPEDYFVPIHSLEFEGETCFAVLSKVENPDFSFKIKNPEHHNGATNFQESKFGHDNYFDAVLRYGFKTEEEYREEVKKKVTQPELVDEYYSLIRNAVSQGCDFSDTAYNIGFLNGKMVCFDTSL